MKKLSLALALLFLCSLSIADDLDQSMHDSFGKAFEAIKEKNRPEAAQHFQQAGQYASQLNEWKGCLDAANALLKLGEPQQAALLVDQGFQIGQSQNDWRVTVACAYAYASLPSDLNKMQNAIEAFKSASQFSKRQNDWIGVTQAANGLIQIGDQDSALPLLTDAEYIVDAAKSPKGAQVIAQIYEFMGMSDAAQAMMLARDKFMKMHEDAKGKMTPPQGWSPVGESVASPKVPSLEQQLAARASADKDIDSKNQYILQQEQHELEREKMANEYGPYYYPPYAPHTPYQPWDWNQLTPWASGCSSTYVYTDGHYHHGGDYSGFGFAYGYSDGGSYFGLSVYVND